MIKIVKMSMLLASSIGVALLSGCVSTEYSQPVKQESSNQLQLSKLDQLINNSYSFDKTGFDLALANTRKFTAEDLYLERGKSKSELRKNMAKGQQKVMLEHIITNLESKNYFRIPFTLQIQRYNPNTQRFGIVISSSSLIEQNVTSIRNFDGKNNFTLQPYSKLYRKDGYSKPSFYTYNLKPLKLLPRFSLSETKSQYKSGSAALRNSVMRINVPSSSTQQFDMNKPKNPKYTGNIKVYIKATPEQAKAWVTEKTQMVAYIKPSIVLHVPHLNDYAVIYNPNDDVYVTENDERIILDHKGSL